MGKIAIYFIYVILILIGVFSGLCSIFSFIKNDYFSIVLFVLSLIIAIMCIFIRQLSKIVNEAYVFFENSLTFIHSLRRYRITILQYSCKHCNSEKVVKCEECSMHLKITLNYIMKDLKTYLYHHNASVKLWLFLTPTNVLYMSDSEELFVVKNNHVIKNLFNVCKAQLDAESQIDKNIFVIRNKKIKRCWPFDYENLRNDLKVQRKDYYGSAIFPIIYQSQEKKEILGFLELCSDSKKITDSFFLFGQSKITENFWRTLCDQMADIVFRYKHCVKAVQK